MLREAGLGPAAPEPLAGGWPELGPRCEHAGPLCGFAQEAGGLCPEHRPGPGLAEDVVQDAWLPLATLAEGRVLEEPVGYLWPRRRTSPVEHQIAEMEVEAVPPLSTPIRSAAE